MNFTETETRELVSATIEPFRTHVLALLRVMREEGPEALCLASARLVPLAERASADVSAAEAPSQWDALHAIRLEILPLLWSVAPAWWTPRLEAHFRHFLDSYELQVVYNMTQALAQMFPDMAGDVSRDDVVRAFRPLAQSHAKRRREARENNC